jgi:hypothetical protein
MVKADVVSTCLQALGALPEAFEKYPYGAAWVGGLVALAMICHTIISIKKKSG